MFGCSHFTVEVVFNSDLASNRVWWIKFGDRCGESLVKASLKHDLVTELGLLDMVRCHGSIPLIVGEEALPWAGGGSKHHGIDQRSETDRGQNDACNNKRRNNGFHGHVPLCGLDPSNGLRDKIWNQWLDVTVWL